MDRDDVPNLIVVIVTFLIAVLYGCVLKFPEVFFRYIHWGWYLGLGIVFFIASVIFGFALSSDLWDIYEKTKVIFYGFTQFFLSACILILMICGVTLVERKTFLVTSAYDFTIMENLPEGFHYTFELQNDIDFNGVEVRKSYGGAVANCTIDGKGYSIKNISYEGEIKESSFTFFRANFQDVTFESCTFYLTPSYYPEGKQEGGECRFTLVDGQLVKNVTVDVTVVVRPAQANYRYNSLSTLGEVKGTSYQSVGDNCTVNINRQEEVE